MPPSSSSEKSTSVSESAEIKAGQIESNALYDSSSMVAVGRAMIEQDSKLGGFTEGGTGLWLEQKQNGWRVALLPDVLSIGGATRAVSQQGKALLATKESQLAAIDEAKSSFAKSFGAAVESTPTIEFFQEILKNSALIKDLNDRVAEAEKDDEIIQGVLDSVLSNSLKEADHASQGMIPNLRNLILGKIRPTSTSSGYQALTQDHLRSIISELRAQQATQATQPLFSAASTPEIKQKDQEVKIKFGMPFNLGASHWVSLKGEATRAPRENDYHVKMTLRDPRGRKDSKLPVLAEDDANALQLSTTAQITALDPQAKITFEYEDKSYVNASTHKVQQADEDGSSCGPITLENLRADLLGKPLPEREFGVGAVDTRLKQAQAVLQSSIATTKDDRRIALETILKPEARESVLATVIPKVLPVASKPRPPRPLSATTAKPSGSAVATTTGTTPAAIPAISVAKTAPDAEASATAATTRPSTTTSAPTAAPSSTSAIDEKLRQKSATSSTTEASAVSKVVEKPTPIEPLVASGTTSTPASAPPKVVKKQEQLAASATMPPPVKPAITKPKSAMPMSSVVVQPVASPELRVQSPPPPPRPSAGASEPELPKEKKETTSAPALPTTAALPIKESKESPVWNQSNVAALINNSEGFRARNWRADVTPSSPGSPHESQECTIYKHKADGTKQTLVTFQPKKIKLDPTNKESVEASILGLKTAYKVESVTMNADYQQILTTDMLQHLLETLRNDGALRTAFVFPDEATLTRNKCTQPKECSEMMEKFKAEVLKSDETEMHKLKV